MPPKNSLKIYVKNRFYHVYNRGVEKRIIFQNKQDYIVFLNYLSEYLSPPPDKSELIKTFTLKGDSFQGVPHTRKNYFGKIELHAYCLMPNHFHLLIKQLEKDVMEKLLRSVCTRYTMYFNKQYNRVGKLYQGTYKAIMVNDDAYLLHLSRYIHLNPAEYTKNVINAYSSYADYLNLRNTNWLNTDFILKYFKGPSNPLFRKINNYKDFVENYEQNSEKILGNITLEVDL